MKTLKLLVILFLFSLQVNASGYAHNMFLAQKKLKSGKELHSIKLKVSTKKANYLKVDVRKATVNSGTPSAVVYIAAGVSDMATLNERIIEEGPSNLFQRNEEEKSDDSLVAKLVGVVKNMFCAFARSLMVRG